MTPFEKAFSTARKAGKKEFEFNGKSFNTKLKDEAGPAKAPAKPKARVAGNSPRPKPRPADKKDPATPPSVGRDEAPAVRNVSKMDGPVKGKTNTSRVKLDLRAAGRAAETGLKKVKEAAKTNFVNPQSAYAKRKAAKNRDR